MKSFRPMLKERSAFRWFSHLHTGHGDLRGGERRQLDQLGFFEDRISFQLLKIRRLPRHTPPYAVNNQMMRQIIETVFPRDRKRAGRWLMIVNLLYRMGLSELEVATEMDCTADAIKSVLRNVTRHFQAGTPMGRRSC